MVLLMVILLHPCEVDAVAAAHAHAHSVGPGAVAAPAQRSGARGLLVLHELLEELADEALGRQGFVVGALEADDRAALLHEVLEVGFRALGALVCELSEAHVLARKHLVEVKEVQGRGSRLPNAWGEDGGVQLRERRLELRRDEVQGCLVDVEARVEANRLS